MNDSFLIRILYSSLSIILIFYPVCVGASEIDLSHGKSNPIEIVKDPIPMTEKQMNDLFGEDPYLGQTSYLQSPDGFSQRDKSK
tara:strand:+ start:497 stop:748 length:252 start_codon:yes stop_codon:yes gene_type:complete